MERLGPCRAGSEPGADPPASSWPGVADGRRVLGRRTMRTSTPRPVRLPHAAGARACPRHGVVDTRGSRVRMEPAGRLPIDGVPADIPRNRLNDRLTSASSGPMPPEPLKTKGFRLFHSPFFFRREEAECPAVSRFKKSGQRKICRAILGKSFGIGHRPLSCGPLSFNRACRASVFMGSFL
jgi:hypothetical protein